MKTAAKFSDDRIYRWWLTREWGTGPWACFCGLNPSTANETDSDPTITREINYAKSWEHGGLLKINLYAYCSTDPKKMWAARKAGIDIVGIQHNSLDDLVHLIVNDFPQVSRVVAAWGNEGGERGRQFGKMGLHMDCIMKAKDGSPRHPLYLPTGLIPEPWNYKAEAA